jgi:tetratricopeptide (TPR) repeat protein
LLLGPSGAWGLSDQELCYQKALARRPSFASRLDWSQTPARRKLAFLEEALGRDPNCAYLHYLKGLVLDVELGRPKDALEAFQRAVDIIETFDLAHENIALIHWAEARRSFARPSLRPDTRQDVFRLTRALAALRRAAEAVGGNPLWGPQRKAHLEDLASRLERELEELRGPEGNSDFLEGGLSRLRVRAWKANVRKGFSLSYPVIATLKRGQILEGSPGHRRYGWVKVLLGDGRPGWVYYRLLEGLGP